MPLKIMKIAVDVTTTVQTQPNDQKFFHTTASLISGPTTYTIAVGDFETDTGAAATELPALGNNNSYFNVYVNGVLQMQDLSAYTAGTSPTGKLDLTVPDGDSIMANTPIVLEVVNFTPSANSTTET
ncbi:DUF4183 domain-containing protein [Guptibacillus algicola]|uniref:DUF4183 domain-containing protein n=1 Tax=Guptibacillus algicola TaxID=225844 RepID=UPI001CD54988|nr:DUF4183 domain-containing protein [Alkalihalobacillus algicola]MCA0988151.1 DUF4183 domain-containing protein [Alkalihalobacillus algicola]